MAMELKVQDYMDIGFRRKYREIDRLSNPVPWLLIGLLTIGIVLFAIGDMPGQQESKVYQSPNGQEIVLSDNGHVIVAADDTVFLLKDDNTQDKGNKGLDIAGLSVMLLSLLGIVIFFTWVPEQCHKEGMKLVEQEFNKTG